MATELESKRSPTPATDLGLRSREIVSKKLGRPVMYTSPSPEHYLGQYRWDAAKGAVYFAREGNPDLAVEEIESLLSHMRPDGMIPNLAIPDAKRHLIDPERKYFRFPNRYSSYGQPPLEALATLETYQAFVRAGREAEGRAFLFRNCSKLSKSMDYQDKYRRNSPDDPRVGVIHPHETGRDSDPTFDFAKKWLKKLPPLRWLMANEVPVLSKGYGTARALANWHDALEFTKSQKRNNWNLAKMRESFWFIDVMYNCMYADNLRVMADLMGILAQDEPGKHLLEVEHFLAEQKRYGQLAKDVEHAILEKMWDKDARGGQGAFYGENAVAEPQKVEVLSISNVFPICLPNIEIDQLKSIAGQLRDDFKTRYPWPSVGKYEPEYDAHNHMKHTLWRGGDWDNVIWYLVERGIRMQLERQDVQADAELYTDLSQIADLVSFRSRRRADMHGHPEFSHPHKGHGQRLAKEADFLWGAGAYHMPVYSDPPKYEPTSIYTTPKTNTILTRPNKQ